MRAADIVFALGATLPLGAAGLAAGAVLERAGVSAKVRERVFSLAFWLGPAASVLAMIGDVLPQPATAEITVVLRGTPLGALGQATRELVQGPYIHLPRVAEILLAAIVLGAALRLLGLGRAWTSLRTLRREAVAAPGETVRAVRAAVLNPSLRVRLSAAASTAVAVGLLKPEILLPERFVSPEAAGLVCRHEAQHIVRRDNLRLFLEQLASALLWFDPLRGVLHRRILAAREERCDAAALAGCTGAQRDLYARTLLEELARPTSPALAAGLTGAGRSCAVTRVSAILDPQPASRRPALTLGLCALLAAAGGGAGYAASQAGQPAPDWVGKVVSAVAAVRPAPLRPIESRHAAHATTAAGKGRAPAPALPFEIADAGPIEAETASLPAGSIDAPDGMVMFVNGDMDTGDLEQLVYRLAATRGVQATPDNKPLLEQAVLRSVADEPRINVEADEAQKFEGATRFTGNVEVTGDLKRAFEGASVLIDGRPAPASLTLSSRLVADAIEFKRMAAIAGNPGRFLSVNIHGVRLAQ